MTLLDSREGRMALPPHHREQQQQQQHGGEPSSNLSWRENGTSSKHRSFVSPLPQQQHYQDEQQQRTTSGDDSSATSTVPEERHTSSHHSQEETPAAGEGSATTPPPSAVAGGSSLTAPAVGDSCGPLRFPTATFSPALKVDQDGKNFTLVSQKTARRWRAVDSTRECQFGEVLRAVELTGGAAEPRAFFAIKELSLDRLREMQGRTHEDPLREVAALQYISSHPNVLTCTEALWDEDSIYVVTPFYNGGEVFEALAGRGRFTESDARQVYRQMLDGLLHLKDHGVCHRDLSLENLLLTEGGIVKVIDFGLALRIPQHADGRAVPLPPQGPCGKQYYMAPEVLTSSSGFDGFAVDVWACGIILFVMLTGVPPFEIALPSRDRRCEIVSVEERLADMLSEWEVPPLSPEVTDLIQSCLLLSAERRPSLEMLLSNPWVNASV